MRHEISNIYSANMNLNIIRDDNIYIYVAL